MKKMKQGTWSVLLGCHSPIHSLIVIIAWWRHYKRFPKLWQIVCILLHDIGHWGKDYLDNYDDKMRHAELGAKIAGKLFGESGYKLVLGHNEYNETKQSELFYPDKLSFTISPLWWLIAITWFEPKLIRPGSTRKESGLMFKNAMIENMKDNFSKGGHNIYLEQWRG